MGGDQSRTQQGKPCQRETETSPFLPDLFSSYMDHNMGRKEYVVRFCGSSVSTKDAYVKKKKQYKTRKVHSLYLRVYVSAVDLGGNGWLYYLIIRCWCSGRLFCTGGTTHFYTRASNEKGQKLCYMLYPIVSRQCTSQIVCSRQLLYFSGQNQGHSFTRVYSRYSSLNMIAITGRVKMNCPLIICP